MSENKSIDEKKSQIHNLRSGFQGKGQIKSNPNIQRPNTEQIFSTKRIFVYPKTETKKLGQQKKRFRTISHQIQSQNVFRNKNPETAIIRQRHRQADLEI